MKLIVYLLLAIVLSGCAAQPNAVRPVVDASTSGATHRMFVVSHGWHTGIVVPAQVLNELLPELRERFGDAPYYELGWGDKGFYQAKEISVGLALRAMFNSEGSVMHVVALPEAPDSYFPQSEVNPLCVSNAQLASVAQFLSQSFARGSDGRPLVLQRGIYGNSQFYLGVGRYHMLHTCNSWTSKGLQSAGMDVVTSLTATGVMRAAKSFSQQCSVITVFAAGGGLRDAAAPVVVPAIPPSSNN